MSQFKSCLAIFPLMAVLLIGCTDENNYYALNNPPEYGVTTLYPTDLDTVRVLMDGTAADTVITGSFRAIMPNNVFVVRCQTVWRGPIMESHIVLYENETDTVRSSDFQMPIVVSDFDTVSAEFELPSFAELHLTIWTDTTGGQAEWVREDTTARFIIAFVDTSH